MVSHHDIRFWGVVFIPLCFMALSHGMEPSALL